MDKAKIDRINQLARKAKAEGLTPEEHAERSMLRNEYLAAVRLNLQAQLDNTYLVDAQGHKRKLQKKKP